MRAFRLRLITLLAGAVGCLVASAAHARTLNGHGAYAPSNSTQATCFDEYHEGIKRSCAGYEAAIYFNLPFDGGNTTVSAVGMGAPIQCRYEVINQDGSSTTAGNLTWVYDRASANLGNPSVPTSSNLRVVCFNVPGGAGLYSIRY